MLNRAKEFKLTFENPVLSFKEQELDAICRVAEAREYRAGQTIFSIGDEDRTMFFVSTGEVELSFGDRGGRKLVTPGNFFGEIAFILTDFRRTGTAKAHTDCRLLCLHQSIYDVLIEEQPHLLCTLLRNTCTYLLESEQKLVSSLSQKNKELKRTLDYLHKTREELDFKEVVARTDELTGLSNRRGLNAFIEELVGQAKTRQTPLGIIMLDLDNFKLINDTWGHDYGDAVLQKVARLLQSETRSSDVVCRRSGDEFVILLPGLSTERGSEVAENIRLRLERDFPPDAAGIKLTGSLGLAFLEVDDSVGDLLLRADRNLYRAKETGRNLVV